MIEEEYLDIYVSQDYQRNTTQFMDSNSKNPFPILNCSSSSSPLRVTGSSSELILSFNSDPLVSPKRRFRTAKRRALKNSTKTSDELLQKLKESLGTVQTTKSTNISSNRLRSVSADFCFNKEKNPNILNKNMSSRRNLFLVNQSKKKINQQPPISVLKKVANEHESFEREIAFMQFCEYKTDLSWRTLPENSFQSDPIRTLAVSVGESELYQANENSASPSAKPKIDTVQRDWAEIRSWIGLLYRYGREAQQRCEHIAGELQEKSTKLVEKDAGQFYARICRIAQDHMIALKAAFLRRLTIYRNIIKNADNDEAKGNSKEMQDIMEK